MYIDNISVDVNIYISLTIKLDMARQMNPLRLTTPIVVLKTVKTRIRRLAKDHADRKGTESDQAVIIRLLNYYEKDHVNEIKEPRTTYRIKI